MKYFSAETVCRQQTGKGKAIPSIVAGSGKDQHPAGPVKFSDNPSQQLFGSSFHEVDRTYRLVFYCKLINPLYLISSEYFHFICQYTQIPGI
jgi:hypothetical protein